MRQVKAQRKDAHPEINLKSNFPKNILNTQTTADEFELKVTMWLAYGIKFLEQATRMVFFTASVQTLYKKEIYRTTLPQSFGVGGLKT